ncbi:Competence protein A [Gimesia algae]|uniref:Competence protein A n=2 Tax=Gimesia algae TaxID=2527971 RepID=A0A517VKI5_9PLAN|nr:Competence protein A [Gimesia algae]
MADYLAINWEKTKLTGLEGHIGVGGVSVKRVFQITWPEHLHPEKDPVSAGSWLKNEFSRLKLSTKQILISFPRHETTVRLLEIPEVPLEEVPEIVHLQTATRSSVPLNQLMLDYLLLPARGGKATREVLVASIAKQTHDHVIKTFQSMGLEITATGISSINAAVWINHIIPAGMEAPALIVNLVETNLEMTLVHQQQISFTSSTAMGSSDPTVVDQTIQTEINRFLLSRSSQLGSEKINQILLIGGRPDCATLLQERLQCTVEVIDPLQQEQFSQEPPEELTSPGVLAGPLGILYSLHQKHLEIVDFLHPHKADQKPDRRKLQMGLGLVGTGLILLTALYLTHQSVSDLDEQIADRQKIQRDLDELLKRGQPTLESVALIQKWENSNSETLKVLQELDTVLPGTDRIYLSELDVNRSSSQSLSRLRAIGNAKEDLDARDLNQQLSKNNFRVHPKRSTNKTYDPEYPVPFEIDAEKLPPRAEIPQPAVQAKQNGN